MAAPKRYSPEESEILVTSSTLAEVNERLTRIGSDKVPVNQNQWQGHKRSIREVEEGNAVAGQKYDRVARLGKNVQKMRAEKERLDRQIAEELEEMARLLSEVQEELGLSG